eukprot:345691_1
MSHAIDYTKHLGVLLLLQQSFHILSIAVYTYGLKKWIDFQQHVMLQQRFPSISKLIVLIAFIGGTLTTIRKWLQFINNNALYSPTKETFAYTLWITFIESSGESLSFLVYGLINIRIFLIYVRWQQTQQQIKKHLSALSLQSLESPSSIPTTPPILTLPSSSQTMSIDIPTCTYKTDIKTDKKSNKRIYNHWCCITIFTFTTIGFLYMMTYRLGGVHVNRTFSNLLWTIMMLVNIILVFVIICQNVKDGIGCLKETLIMLIYTFLVAVSGLGLYFMRSDSVLYFFLVVLTSISFFQGAIPLYFGLYYVYKIEHTLNKNKWKENQKTRVCVHSNMQSDANTEMESETESETEIYVQFDPDVKFYDFLKKFYNYKAFGSYLSYCWAMENLLFLERTSVIYHIILKYKQLYDNEKDVNSMNKMMKLLKFKYLKSLYVEYNHKIKQICPVANKTGNGYDIEYFKPAFKKIYKEIYTEFVDDNARNEINISGELRGQLSFIMDNNMSKLVSFDDFLSFFQEVNDEIYGMLISMYTANFAEYLSNL